MREISPTKQPLKMLLPSYTRHSTFRSPLDVFADQADTPDAKMRRRADEALKDSALSGN